MSQLIDVPSDRVPTDGYVPSDRVPTDGYVPTDGAQLTGVVPTDGYSIVTLAEGRIYVNRYFRIQPPIPSNFILKIFQKAYLTFGNNMTSFLQPTDK